MYPLKKDKNQLLENWLYTVLTEFDCYKKKIHIFYCIVDLESYEFDWKKENGLINIYVFKKKKHINKKKIQKNNIYRWDNRFHQSKSIATYI